MSQNGHFHVNFVNWPIFLLNRPFCDQIQLINQNLPILITKWAYLNEKSTKLIENVPIQIKNGPILIVN